MLGAGRPNPRYSASLNALRSIARLAASRTRWSAHGDFGSHCWVKTSHWLTVGSTTLRVRPGVRLTSSASGPLSPYAMSLSPRLTVTMRVASSGTDLNTKRFTAGVFRQ
jgi:hypothetical protein